MSLHAKYEIKCDGGGSEPCRSSLGPFAEEVNAYRSRTENGWGRGQYGKDLCPRCFAQEIEGHGVPIPDFDLRAGTIPLATALTIVDEIDDDAEFNLSTQESTGFKIACHFIRAALVAATKEPT